MWRVRMMPTLGLGIGWRPELALAIERREALGFVEVTAENIRLDDIPPALTRMVARGFPVIVHGLSLSLGGAERPDTRRLDHLVRVAQRLGARLVSEHLAFVRAEGLEAGHLLPVPRTREALEVIVENGAWGQENAAVPAGIRKHRHPGGVARERRWTKHRSWLSYSTERTQRCSSMFPTCTRTRATAGGIRWWPWLGCPLGRLAYVHVAGGTVRDDLYHDTHAHPVGAGPLALLEELCSQVAPPGVMLERDDDFPRESELEAELEAIRMAIARGAARRIGNPN